MRRVTINDMKVFFGADHRGFDLKNRLYKRLKVQGHEVVDCGPEELSPQDDYPDYAEKVAKKVAAEAGSLGILLCGSGVGVAVAANKVRGARAAIGYRAEEVTHGRARDNINVLALSSDYLSPEDAFALADLFISTPFGGEERDVRRLEKITGIEMRQSS